MSSQLKIEGFFKSKLHARRNMDNRKKKLNMSLNKVTPTKAPKLGYNKNLSGVINLVSDDENYLSDPFSGTVSPDIPSPNSSDTTIIYSPETPSKKRDQSHSGRSNKTPLSSQLNTEPRIHSSLSSDIGTSNTSPLFSQSIAVTSNTSPLSSLPNSGTLIHSSLSPQSKTGTPKRKFYSPTKKRCSTLRTPNKARKNLSNSLGRNVKDDGDFIQIDKGLNDKTTFMVEIIQKFLKDETLRPLLNQSSCHLLKEFVCETNYGLKLVCNLYGRKERWFKWEEIKNVISKQRIDDVSCHLMLDSLLQKNIFVASNYQGHKHSLSFDEYIAILKKDELLTICKQYKLKPSSKQDCIKLLRGYTKQKSNITAYFVGTSTTNNENRVMRSLAEKTGACFKLSELIRRTLDELYILMYLGMDYTIIREKKLELTLINDKANLQTFPYKNVKTDNASVVFNSREEFERYLNALSIYERYSSETDLNKQCDWVRTVYQMYKDINEETMESYSAKPAWLYKFTPPNIFVKVLEDGIKFLKQDKKAESVSLALEILSMLIVQTTFRQHRKPEWYAEKALIMDKFESRSDEAALILLEGLNLDQRDEAKDLLRRRASLLAKRQTNCIGEELQVALLQHSEAEDRLERQFDAEHVYKQPKENYRGGKIKFETRTDSGIAVQEAEDYCLTYYIRTGKYTHGGHWEGRIITTIFFLLFWDEIYAPLPGVPGLALCPYQQFPLDLWGEDFQRNRAALLPKRLAHIERSDTRALVESMRTVWDTRPENELSGINRGIPWEHVSAVCECLGPLPLAAICRRLASHYGYTHSGFPDLTLWNCHTKKIAFVEVKTDSDRPSMKQLQWMQYLKQNSIAVEFCYVGINTSKCRARRSEPAGPLAFNL